MASDHLTTKKGDFIEAAERLLSKQIEWRRHFHQYPELAFEEFKTTKFLQTHIKKFGLKLLPLKTSTGILAQIETGKPGPIVAIRTDIDALPITECTGVKYASKTKGRMHACGHDVHMATVLGTAAILAKMKKELRGKIRFIFQPAEECPPGGARPMIENGAIEGVDILLGLHVDPELPTGKISTRDGITMASVFDFDLVIKGIGGHAARPHKAVDPIVTAAEVIDSIQKITAREIDPASPVVITFGQISGGNARNVIPEAVYLKGTARTLSSDMYKKIPGLIRRTVAGICKARGAKFELNRIADYPVLKNNASVNRLIEKNYAHLFGQNKIAPCNQTLGGEDFACYLQKVKGAMFRLGVMNRKLKADKPWHSPQFMVDENAIKFGTALLVATTIDYLESKR